VLSLLRPERWTAEILLTSSLDPTACLDRGGDGEECERGRMTNLRAILVASYA
jgi:hypothetical protein